MKSITRKLNMTMLVTGVALGGFSAISNAEVISLNAVEDTVLLDGNGENWNGLEILGSELGTNGPGSIWISVLKFDLSSLTGMAINSASFDLTSFFNHSPGTFSHEVFSSSDDSWAEATVTGLDRPSDASLTFLSSTDINEELQTYSWDVLAGVSGMDGLEGENNWLTLFLRPDLAQAGTAFGPHFYGSESDNVDVPVLIIDADPIITVPEPVTLALLGLAGISFLRKKKTV